MRNYFRNLIRAILGKPPVQTQDGPGPFRPPK